MTRYNPFPESEQKAYLRRHHLLKLLDPHRTLLGRGLAYFGLPSAEMLDIRLWASVLNSICAIERSEDVALRMYRTAQSIGVRDRLTVVEMDLTEVSRLMVMDDSDNQNALVNLPQPIARNLHKARSIGYDVLNLDMCGGFLYPKRSKTESSYEQMLRNLINYQAQQQMSFFLVVTFNTRDAGKSEYDKFIAETIKFLGTSGLGTTELKQFYTAKSIKGQPPNLRRLRFCVPTYIHKIAHEYFEVQHRGAWYYKTFYHTVLYFTLRQGRSILGPWPPIDEVKELVSAPLLKLSSEGGSIVTEELWAPQTT